MIPYGRQSISEEDIAAVVAVLRSDFLTQGPAVPAFERVLAQYCGAPHAVAVNSATSALHIACVALGLGPGDLLWTTPNTFVASANCARYCGADLDFVDIDPRTYNLCPQALAAKLERAAAEDRLPKILVPVHFSGQPCDMRAIGRLARQYGVKIIEDASHAIGADYAGEKVGACSESSACVFSFHPVKIVTTAEGGAITTRDPELAAHLQRLRSHGITREALDMRGPAQGPWYYEQIELGWNYRMTDLQAALGTSQMQRLDAFVARRCEIVARYEQALAGLPLQRPAQLADTRSAWHLYVVQVAERARVFARLRESGVGVNVHYIPVHLQPYYRALGFGPGHCPVAEAYYARALSLPMFPDLDAARQTAVVHALEAALA